MGNCGGSGNMKTTFDVNAQLVKLRELKKTSQCIGIQAFDETWFNTLTEEQKQCVLQCVNSGVENPDSQVGVYAMRPKDYDEFKPFFSKVLEAYHKVDLSSTKHVNNWNLSGVEGIPEDGNLDLSALGLPALSMRVRVGRNLNRYPLPGAMTREDRLNMEIDMGKVFDVLIKDEKFGGEYVSLSPSHPKHIDATRYDQLVKEHIMFKDMSADSFLVSCGIASEWPYGRGCYFSSDKQCIVWVGEEDHLRIMCMQKGVVLNAVFDRLKTLIDTVEKNIDGGCAQSPDYGVVTSCPTNCGTGMRASVHIALPKLTKGGSDVRAKEICKPLGLSVRGLGGEHTPIGEDGTVDISPSKRFCISESEIVVALYKGIKLVKEAEDKE